MLDKTYIKHIENSKLLSQNTKTIYVRNLRNIKEHICSDLTHKKKCYDYIIEHPREFLKSLNKYIERTGYSIHQKLSYITAIEALFRHTPSLIQQKPELYTYWLDMHKEEKEPVNTAYLTNEPSERHKEAYMTGEEIREKMNALPMGHRVRLLIAMYVLMPPVRNDYYNMPIFHFANDIAEFRAEESKILAENDNVMVLIGSDKTKPREGLIILQKYKTAKIYKTLENKIPAELLEEIGASLAKTPRDHLFINQQKQPYERANSFDQWANRSLQKALGNDKITLNVLRHIYISENNPEGKSGTEKNKIARQMGHSVATQNKYNWFIYTENGKVVRKRKPATAN